MAITVVQGAQSAGGGNASTIAISATSSGNGIVSCFSQSNANTPSAVCGANSLTVNATKAVYNGSTETVWVAYGNAPAGATAVTWTPGTSATGHGVCAWELAGVANPVVLDFATALHTDNLSAATGATPTVTTNVAGTIVLIGVGASAGSGTISAWTGTNVATNIATTTARCFGGSFITGSTISSAFTANWATSHVAGIIAIGIKVASANINLAIPAAVATASSTTPGLQISPAMVAAVATASAPTPGLAVSIPPAAAVATASAPTPGVSLRIAPAAAVATASAPTPGVTIVTSGGDGVPTLMLMGVG